MTQEQFRKFQQQNRMRRTISIELGQHAVEFTNQTVAQRIESLRAIQRDQSNLSPPTTNTNQ
jgi:hypothetical protein